MGFVDDDDDDHDQQVVLGLGLSTLESSSTTTSSPSKPNKKKPFDDDHHHQPTDLTLGLSTNHLYLLHTCTSVVSSPSPFYSPKKKVKREKELSSTTTEETEEINIEDHALNIGRKKLRLTKQQSALLEESFKQYPTLNHKQKQGLARQLNLRERQVEVWFQNRRARTKLKQNEADCDSLKKHCEKLTDENKRLQEEVQELKAFKGCMHICLSCGASKS